MKAVIFDMDGVIFDSERAIFYVWEEIAERHGLKDVNIPLRACIGVTAEASRKIFRDYYGQDFPIEQYRLEEKEIWRQRYSHGRLPMKPGIKELLTELQARHLPAAVASSTNSVQVTQQITDAGLAPFFRVIVGGEQVSRSKPHPDIFLKAAEALEQRAEDCAVIEDSYNGIRAAVSAGMFPIMVPDLVPPDDEMRQKAGIILPDLLKVRDWLTRK